MAARRLKLLSSILAVLGAVPAAAQLADREGFKDPPLQYSYTVDETRGAPAGRLQILRNYQNAAAKVGGNRQPMQQDVTANEAAFQSGLAEEGHVEVAGILFDFDRSEINPESQPALKEMAKLLRDNPSLRVWVVEHTDNSGSAEANQFAIDAKRLSPHGAGPFAPVACNKSEPGRARNRRVELVEQQ